MIFLSIKHTEEDNRMSEEVEDEGRMLQGAFVSRCTEKGQIF